jgi:peptidoglycan-associated lipoprotein
MFAALIVISGGALGGLNRIKPRHVRCTKGSSTMNLRPLSLLAGLLLLAACSQNPSNNGTGTGTTGANTTTQSTVVPGSAQDFIQNVGDRVFFDFDKSVIKPEGQQTLQRQAQWLQKYPNVTVTVEGHCDDRGTREYNLALGERRANAVRQALVALGVQANRIKTISYGKERPAVLGDNEAAWAQNRRGVTVIN